MQVMLMRLMSKGEYVIVPKGTKFMGAGKLGLKALHPSSNIVFGVSVNLVMHQNIWKQVEMGEKM